MAREVRDAVVVVTGATSGIGMATALAFAGQGARLVLAARRGEVLETVARRCQERDAEALAVPTDVTDPEAVQRLAEAALSAFGRIDVWVNGAGVGVFGAFEDADIALHRRTVEVNLLGPMNAAAAVLPVFRRQGRGILVNVISLGAWAPTPFAAAYTASKFGLRGFTASLRQQFNPCDDIHVCGVFPAMVDTPGFVHGANVSGRHLDPGPFLYRSEDVARTILRLARHPRGEVAVGWPARAGQIAYNLAPRATELVMGAVFRHLLSRAGPAERTEGALLEPIAAGQEPSGGWLGRKGLPPAGQISLGLAAVGGVALTIGLAALLRGPRHRPAPRRLPHARRRR